MTGAVRCLPTAAGTLARSASKRLMSATSADWKKVYNKRVSVERVFSRLKGYRKLNGIRTRPKVWLHVALSLLTMNGAALVSAGLSESVRRCVA